MLILLFASNFIVYFYFRSKSKELVEKVKGLYNKINEDGSYIESLQKNLKEAEDLLENSEKKNKELYSEAETKDQNIQKLENYINENHTEIVILNSTIENYQNQIEILKQNINRLEKDLYHRNVLLQKKESMMQDFMESRSSIDNKILALGENVKQKEKDLLVDNFASYESKVKELQYKVQELEGNLKKSDLVLQEKEQVNFQLEGDLNVLNGKLSKLEGSFNRDETAITILKDKMESLTIEIEKYKKKISYLQTELENSNKQLQKKENSISELNLLNEKLNQKIFSLEENTSQDKKVIRELQNDFHTTKTDLESLNQKFANTQKDLIQTNLLLQRKSANIVELNKLIETLQTDLRKIREEKELLRIISNFISMPSVKTYNDTNIKNIRSFTLKELVPFLENLRLNQKYAIFEEVNFELNRWESYSKKPWLKDKVVISVMGQFNAGKSTFINSILDDSLLPVGVVPTTAIPSYITYGIQLDIDGVDFQDNYREFNENYFSKLNKEFTESYPLHRIIKHFVIRYEKDLLKGKTFLDTPGIQSLDEIDKQKAIESIQESDVVFWLINITDGDINQESIRFLKEFMEQKTLYIVVNQADRESPKNALKIKNQIQNSLRENQISFKDCIIYSSKVSNYREELLKIITYMDLAKPLNFREYILNLLDRILDEVVAELKKHKEEKFIIQNQLKENENAIQKGYGTLNSTVDEMDNFVKSGVKKSLFPFNKKYIIKDYSKFIKNYKNLKSTIPQIKFQINERVEEIGKNSIHLEQTEMEIDYYEDLKNELIKLQKRFRLIVGEI